MNPHYESCNLDEYHSQMLRRPSVAHTKISIAENGHENRHASSTLCGRITRSLQCRESFREGITDHAGYGAVRTYATLLGFDDHSGTRQETLDEEGDTDKLLTEIAMSSVNIDALADDEDQE